MSSVGQTAAPASSSQAPGSAQRPAAGPRRQLLTPRPRLHHLPLAGILAFSALLNTNRLSQNGYANIFYSAGVKSMLHSWHNFVFVSFDPGGLVSVDKPPLALWVQAASAKLFGFSPLSLLLPEAIAGVLAVALLYHLLARRLGAIAGLAGASAMAVFPSFVAVSRDNGVDSILILLMLLACGAGLRGAETGRLRTLLCSAVLVGLAFNTKTLAAILVVPGIAVAYLLCAPGSLVRRSLHLLLCGAVMALVCFVWIAFVDLTPASKRPFVGSSTNNSELGLTFEYNGFGRVEGQLGGPGQILVRPGARVPLTHHAHPKAAPAANASVPHTPHATVGRGSQRAPASSVLREKNPIPFGGSPGPLRLFGKGLGDQGGWMLPFALFGLLALGALALLDRRAPDSPPALRPAADGASATGASATGASATGASATGTTATGGSTTRGAESSGLDSPPASGPVPIRRDPRLVTAIVLGGWFLVEAVLLSTSKGIVHPYYVSALAPGTGAMAGAGVEAFIRLARGRWRLWGLAFAPLAVAATVATQVLLMHRAHYMIWFEPVLVIAAGVTVITLIALPRLAAPSVVLVFLVLLVVPAAYASTTWLAPVEGTFPAAGPKQSAGAGGFGVNRRGLAVDLALLRYVRTHGPGSRWALLTVASDTAAPLILEGLDAGALGGYSGSDPALDGPGFARLVAAGGARYVLLGGEFSMRGGNGATKAVLRACRQLAPDTWNSPSAYPFGLTLFDCAGRARALAS